MPVHDWTRVSAGVFHHLHGAWINELSKALNGLLPPEYYALSEQVAGEAGPDVLTLKARDDIPPMRTAHEGLTAVAEVPPEVSLTAMSDEAAAYALRRRQLVIRHSSGDEIVALVEILSLGNKNRRLALDQFLDKAISVLNAGYHLMVIDLYPPGPLDPNGIHGEIWAEFSDAQYRQPPDRPLTAVSYSAGLVKKAYIEPVAIGSPLPKMPLFLEEGWYIDVPLESTYQQAYAGVPQRWRSVIEGS